MKLYEDVYTGEVVFNDDFVQLDDCFYTLPDFDREVVLDDELSDMELYEQVEHPESYEAFVSWCKSNGYNKNSRGALELYIFLLER